VNPFDWHGPEFLLFYVAFALVVLFVAGRLRRLLENGPVPRLTAVDPYVIAHLRAGPAEAIRTAVLSLVDRGLLKVEGTTVVAPDQRAPVKRALERAILAVCASPQEAPSLFAVPRVTEACQPLTAELRALKLLPTADQVRRRVLMAVAVLSLLGGTALAKVQIALGRGRHNVAFLILLALAASITTIIIFARRRTSLGDRVVGDLKELFAGLRGRAQELPTGGATNEMAMLMGVFGIAALVGDPYVRAASLFPKAAADGESGGGGGGTSCGSASSCGGGGGCGGGGCGGGCGGCGG
jgi:uncharacterized protein (TIGR04222 family)